MFTAYVVDGNAMGKGMNLKSEKKMECGVNGLGHGFGFDCVSMSKVMEQEKRDTNTVSVLE